MRSTQTRKKKVSRRPSNIVRVYEKLQHLGRQAQEQMEEAEKNQIKLDHYHAETLGHMTVSLSAFCRLDLEWHVRRWDEFEKMIHEAVAFPYPTYRPLMRSNLVSILAVQ